MNALRALWRLGRALAHALSGLATIVLVFPGLDAAQREQRVQAWAQSMLALLGIRLEVRGTPPARGPILLVANHISWLDILVIHAARHCRFVAKAEVRHWPLIGRLASGGGTLYIERESRRDALRVVHHMADCLRAGDILAVFPEGTTSDGTGLLPFHANLLQAAVATGTPVQPVGLRFSDCAEPVSQAAAYVGDTHLLRSLWSVVTAHGMRAQVTWLSPVDTGHVDRRLLAEGVRDQIRRAISVKS